MPALPPADTRIVVAAVVRRDDGRVLVGRRPAGKHLAGLWEFPGGALEMGESPVDGLRREILEELGTEADVGSPITFAWHRDEHRAVLLLFYAAHLAPERVECREGQELRWVTIAELATLPTPPGDAALIAQLATGEGLGVPPDPPRLTGGATGSLE